MKSRRLSLLLGLLLVSCRIAARPIQAPLPSDIPINNDAGRGGLLIVTVRLKTGEELPFVVDTGAPLILLDKSLVPKLGPRLGTTTIYSFSGKLPAGLYKTPKLYLGGVPLQTATNVFSCDFKKLPFPPKIHVAGIIGMDCLANYCFQLDFQSGKIRFLDPVQLNHTNLGKAYPLSFSLDSGNIEAVSPPLIHNPGILGGTAVDSEIDTGNNADGMALGPAIRRHAAGSYSGGPWKRFKHFLAVKGLVNRAAGNLNCVWEGNTYTNVAVSRAPREAPSWIGLRFLARHLVTFDFPNHTMYLKQTSIGPITNPPDLPTSK